MTQSLPSVFIVDTFYPEFLAASYSDEPQLGRQDYEIQLGRLLRSGFGVSDAYAHGLTAAGCDVRVVIANADRAQARWAAEHDLAPSGDVHAVRREIVAAQIAHTRPDVVYVFEWCPLGDALLAAIKRHTRLLVGQLASPPPAGRTFAAYDLIVSSYRPIVAHFRNIGAAAEYHALGFDERVPARIAAGPPRYDVTFVGGFAPSHPNRVPWLERVLECVNVDIFGYGLENVPATSPIRAHHRGPAWGYAMYDVLARSRVTLNLHAVIDVGGPPAARTCANNMRLYEATGVGTCLVTDHKDDLAERFEPDREVATFTNADECAEKVAHLLTHEPERAAIARAGRQRTLRDHTYTSRMAGLLDMLQRYLYATHRASCSAPDPAADATVRPVPSPARPRKRAARTAPGPM
ncbi:MAG: glycosyltransferase [Phycisphaerae bacterium]